MSEEKEDLDKDIAELVKTIENTGEPFFKPIIIANKLGWEQIQKEFDQPIRVLPGGKNLASIYGIDVIVQDTDYLGLCRPYSRMYKSLLREQTEIDEFKIDFYKHSILEAKKEIRT